MSRVTNGIVTFADLAYMVANDGFKLKGSAVPSSNKCMTKSEIESYIYFDTDVIFSYDNNQLVPFQKITKGISLSITSPQNINFNGGTYSFDVISTTDFSISDNVAWLSLSPSSGITGITTITATFNLNPNNSTRNANLRVTSLFTGEILDLVLIQGANAGVPTDLVQLAFGSSYGNACTEYSLGNVSSFFIPDGQTFEFATDLFINSNGATRAISGHYSDGSFSRFWIGSNFNAFTDLC